MKQPDRFDKAATNLRLAHIAAPYATQIPMEAWPSLEWRIAALLRREHQAVVRMVKKEFSKMAAITQNRTNSNGRIVMAHYKALQCRDILNQLARRRR